MALWQAKVRPKQRLVGINSAISGQTVNMHSKGDFAGKRATAASLERCKNVMNHDCPYEKHATKIGYRLYRGSPRSPRRETWLREHVEDGE